MGSSFSCFYKCICAKQYIQDQQLSGDKATAGNKPMSTEQEVMAALDDLEMAILDYESRRRIAGQTQAYLDEMTAKEQAIASIKRHIIKIAMENATN